MVAWKFLVFWTTSCRLLNLNTQFPFQNVDFRARLPKSWKYDPNSVYVPHSCMHPSPDIKSAIFHLYLLCSVFWNWGAGHWEGATHKLLKPSPIVSFQNPELLNWVQLLSIFIYIDLTAMHKAGWVHPVFPSFVRSHSQQPRKPS